MRSNQSHGASSGAYANSSRSNSRLLLISSLGVLVAAALLLIFSGAIAGVWKLLTIVLVVAAAAAGVYSANQFARCEAQLASDLAQAESGLVIAQNYKPLLENYQQ